MVETIPLPDQLAVQQRYDEAQIEGVSPCMWFPPKWETGLARVEIEADNGTKKTVRLLPSNSADDGKDLFKDLVPRLPDLTKEKAKYDQYFDNRDAKWIRNKVQNGTDLDEDLDQPEKKWPSPLADFSHIDDSEFPNQELTNIEKALGNKHNAVVRLKSLVGPESAGMKRLGAVFEWVLYRTSVFMKEINDALEKQNGADYTQAREHYIAFLRDLDNHEPEKHGKKLDVMNPRSPSGYGRALKWACIDPVIFRGLIVGVRVIIHWNPHSSSNGIPIKHPPIPIP